MNTSDQITSSTIEQDVREFRKLHRDASVHNLHVLRRVGHALSDKATDAERIEEAMEKAINTEYGAGTPMRDAIRLWFGLDASTRQMKASKRHRPAWERLEEPVSYWTFTSHWAKKHYRFISQRLFALYRDTAVAMSDGIPAPEPAHHSDTEDERDPHEADGDAEADVEAGAGSPAEKPSRPSRRYVATAIVGLLVISALVAAWALDGSAPRSAKSRSLPLPPPGSVVNATTGEVVDGIPDRPIPKGSRVADGNILRACNVSAGTPCNYLSWPSSVEARTGDIIRFNLRLHNPALEPLPYAKLFVISFPPVIKPSLAMAVFVRWRDPATGEETRGPLSNSLEVLLPTQKADFAYIHGSSKLLDNDGRVLARLPDGIIGRHITLTQVGRPRACSSCDLKYVRFVTFKVRVVDQRD